jgi:hypothetical protein
MLSYDFLGLLIDRIEDRSSEARALSQWQDWKRRSGETAISTALPPGGSILFAVSLHRRF